MRVLVVGASGTIGRAVVAELEQRHEVIAAGRSSGELRTDITDITAIRTMFEKVESVDALVSAAGTVKFAPFEDMTEEDYEIGLKDKLMGQVNLVLVGRDYLSDGGSFTLTTGVLDTCYEGGRHGSEARKQHTQFTVGCLDLSGLFHDVPSSSCIRLRSDRRQWPTTR